MEANIGNLKCGRISPVAGMALLCAVACYAGVSAAGVLEETYDVVVVGGTSYGVAAAMASQEAGAKVFVAAPRSYLGEDLAGKYVLLPENGDDDSHPLYAKLWAGQGAAPILKELLEKPGVGGHSFLFERDGAPAIKGRTTKHGLRCNWNCA